MTRTEQLQLNLGHRDPKREAEKVNRLRFKLGEKAKQEPKFKRLTQHLMRRSQRRYRPPKGVSMYKHLYKLGLKYL